jgi:hypothetical protein
MTPSRYAGPRELQRSGPLTTTAGGKQGRFLVRAGPFHGGAITALVATRGPPGPALAVMAGIDGRISAYDWARNVTTDLGAVGGRDAGHPGSAHLQAQAQTRHFTHLTTCVCVGCVGARQVRRRGW